MNFQLIDSLRLPSAVALLSLSALPVSNAQERTAAAEPIVEYSGTLWQERASEIEGRFRILLTPKTSEAPAKRVLELGAGFRTSKGPDLKLVLSPLAMDKLSHRNALEKSHILGPLKSARGRQAYELPQDIDLARYRSLLIHCEAYSKLWGAVPLRRGEVLANGLEWQDKTYEVEGAYEFARVGGELVLRLGQDFDTRKGPDLKLVLSPSNTKQVRSATALKDGLILAPLRSNEGTQEYRLPAGTDLGRYRSLLIHCERYTKLWAAAEINLPTKP